MLQDWNDLFYAHYQVDPQALEEYLPKGLKPDLFDGKAFVGVVALKLRNIRFSSIKWLHYPSLNELNLRTYVRTENGEGFVYFFSLDCTSQIPVSIARLFYRLPYRKAKMKYVIQENQARLKAIVNNELQADYRYAFHGEEFEARKDPLANFLIERYRFITATKTGSFYRGDLSHPPYLVHQATITKWKDPLIESNGLTRLDEQLIPEAYYTKSLEVKVKQFGRCDGNGVFF